METTGSGSSVDVGDSADVVGISGVPPSSRVAPSGMMTGESRVTGEQGSLEGEADAESDPHSRREARQTLRLCQDTTFEEDSETEYGGATPPVSGGPTPTSRSVPLALPLGSRVLWARPLVPVSSVYP